MRIKPHRLLFAALLAPAMISPAISAQDAPEPSRPMAMDGKAVIEAASNEVKAAGWELGIDFSTPRRIEILQADGSTKPYWYVIYRVINANTTEDGSTGVPVSTDISFFVETVNGKDTLNEPAAMMGVDDLREKLIKEVAKERNPSSSADDSENVDKATIDIANERYRDNHNIHGNANNPWVLNAIAQREGMIYFADSTKPLTLLNPLSAMQRYLGLVYDVEGKGQTYYSGVRAVPKTTRIASEIDPEIQEVNRLYPVVDSNGTFVRWFTEDEAREHKVSNDEIIVDNNVVVMGPKSRWFGMLLKSKYRAGDVVGADGRVIRESEPGYHSARAAFGELGSDGGDVMIAKVRTYADGDMVMNGFDTGVKRSEGRGTYKVFGRILNNEEQLAAQAGRRARADAGRVVRGPDRESDINRLLGRTNDAIASASVEVDSGTEMFGRPIMGQPVKTLDRFGRPVAKELVLYAVGEYVTEDEYNIWAARRGEETSWADSGLANRPLVEGDFLVNAPKIRMGKSNSGRIAKESLTRLIPANESDTGADVVSDNFATGRRYSPRDVSPEKFTRDADGTFFSFRIAPIMGANAENSALEYYEYAPLGRADTDAVPVPAFDDFGVWEDWQDPATGKPIALRDAQGRVIRDRLGVVQNLKSFEYEWRYSFERQPEMDDSAHQRDRSHESFTVKSTMKEGDREVNAWMIGDTFCGLALVTVYIEAMVGDKKVIFPIDQVASKTDFDYTKFKDSMGKEMREFLEGFPDVKYTEPGQMVLANGEIRLVGPEGASVSTTKLTQYHYNALVEAYASGGGASIPSPDKNADYVSNEIRVTPFSPRSGRALYQTWEKATFPAPLVEDGKPVTRRMVELASGLREDNADAIFGTKHLISERYGVLILSDVDDGWDFMNIAVRGLRSSLDTSRLAKDDSGRHMLTPKYKDWVYLERFAKPGDEYDVERDLISRKRGQWFLLNREE
ncbi:MAG: hypothetical protein KDB07_09780 [Planctomycetes bacterium]|nr:hypothetical protein [Planctomycetota bacterium]